jgi:hypothetical protein
VKRTQAEYCTAIFLGSGVAANTDFGNRHDPSDTRGHGTPTAITSGFYHSIRILHHAHDIVHFFHVSRQHCTPDIMSETFIFLIYLHALFRKVQCNEPDVVQ